MYIDKEKYTQRIKDNAKRIEIRKILDKIEMVINKHIIQTTDFLDPYEIYLAESVLNRFIDINYLIEGGYEDSERKIIVIYPNYISKKDIVIPISFLEINGDLSELKHRDYLGAILSLGLTREKVGDIIVKENSGIIILKEEIISFVIYNLGNIKNKNVNVTKLDKQDLKVSKSQYMEIDKFIVSLRVDSIISAVLNLSRKESINIIKAENIKVNFKLVEKPSKEIKEGDTISVKGFGRFILYQIKGRSKSGRFICTIRIIL